MCVQEGCEAPYAEPALARVLPDALFRLSFYSLHQQGASPLRLMPVCVLVDYFEGHRAKPLTGLLQRAPTGWPTRTPLSRLLATDQVPSQSRCLFIHWQTTAVGVVVCAFVL